MVRLLVYGHVSVVRSSRAIERRCVDDVGFRSLAAGQVPDFRSVAKVGRRHLGALAGLLPQSLRLAQRMGMVPAGPGRPRRGAAAGGGQQAQGDEL